MNTFLPLPSFRESAKCLDNKRLNKQVLECDQILAALRKEQRQLAGLEPVTRIGWINHPAVRQWRGYLWALKYYRNTCLREWLIRGFKSTRVMELMLRDELGDEHGAEVPCWLGRADFHSSHRSNLLRKDPVWYGQFGWTEPHDLPYVWPSKESKKAHEEDPTQASRTQAS